MKTKMAAVIIAEIVLLLILSAVSVFTEGHLQTLFIMYSFFDFVAVVFTSVFVGLNLENWDE